MFDEPVNGLDPEGIHWIRNLMKALAAEGRTVFVSRHLMSEMALTADHLVVIGQGRLLADTSMADFIQQNSRSLRPAALPAAGAAAGRAARGRGHRGRGRPTARWRSTAATAEQLGELAAQHQLVLHELSPQRASLEEAFMQLTAESVEYHAHARRAGRRATAGAAGPGSRSPP